MTNQEMKDLKPGDIVCHVSNSLRYIVTANYGDRVTVVRTHDLTNPIEWRKVTS